MPLQRATRVASSRYGWSDYRVRTAGGLGSEASDTQAGSAEVGKAKIDCLCQWSKAEWGYLGRGTPAGILYNDITIREPLKHRLRSATICITMSESPSLYALGGSPSRSRHSRANKKPPMTEAPESPVQVTEHFGPMVLLGPQIVKSKSKTAEWKPTFGAMGASLGGVGMSRSESGDEKHSEWEFRGMRAADDGGLYRTLEWVFVGGDKTRRGSEFTSHTFNTAFTFQHCGTKAVYMRIGIEGKLENLMRRGIKSFSSLIDNNDRSVVTAINFNSDFSFEKDLKDVAQNLDKSMIARHELSLPWISSGTKQQNASREATSSDSEREDQTKSWTEIETASSAITKALLNMLQDQTSNLNGVAKPDITNNQEVELQNTRLVPDIKHESAVQAEEEQNRRRVQELLESRAFAAIIGILARILGFLYPPPFETQQTKTLKQPQEPSQFQ